MLTAPGRPRRRVSCVLLLLLACTPDDPPPGVSVDLRDTPFPCRQQGYPCTWNEVPDAIVERTKHLGEIAARLTLTTPSLAAVADFLTGREGVADVRIDGTGVRYRLHGGRPAWVFLPSELDHHRATPGTTVVSHVDRNEPYAALGASAQAVGRWILPRPLHASVAVRQRRQEVAGEPGEGKKALVLSPYEFEFPNVGALISRRARLIRDYRERAGGSVEFHADLNKYDDNPADPGSAYRTVGGDATLTGEVVFEDFLHWNDYNLIVLATHGGNSSCDASIPRGGRPSEEPADAASQPGPDPAGGCPIIYAGRAKQQAFGDVIGVDIYFATGTVRQTDRPPAQQTRFDTPGQREWRDDGRIPDRGLTRAQADACVRRVLAGESDPVIDGTRCLAQQWEHDNPMLALWWPFFINQYPDGLNDAIVFLAACHSAKGNVLLDALAPAGNDAITVFGFNTATYAPRAWALIDRMLELVDGGYHSDELVRRLRAYDEQIGQDPEYQHQPDCTGDSCTTPTNPDSVLRGRALDPLHETLPDIPAELVDEVPVRTHGRDVVLLVDPRTGEELRDGATVQVIGTPDDDRDDMLRVHPQIIGIARDDDLRSVQLRVRVVDEAPPDGSYRPDREVADGAHRYARDVALGRDHAEGEVVDLEVSVELPGGGLSRWVYEDVRLGGLCYWSGTLRGSVEREVGGGSVGVGSLDGGSEYGVFGSITLSQAPGVEGGEGVWFQVRGHPAEGEYTINSRRGDAGAMISSPEAPMGVVRRGRLRLAMVSDTMTVGGFVVEYDGLMLPDFGSGTLTLQGEFVWTPSCPTFMDHMLDIGERTSRFLDGRSP